MRIPFVIENQQYTMSDVLNGLLMEQRGRSLDVATAYFNVGGWQLLQRGLARLGTFRLLLGDEPEVGADIGVREQKAKAVKGLMRELEQASFDGKTQRVVEDLTAFLQRENVQVRSAVELSEFQEDAVKKARKILLRYDGVMVADSVGLGKTWIGKKLLEDYAYHLRYKALVICTAALQKMWNEELLSAGIAARIVTQEILGREEYDVHDVMDADVVLVDESHNFRNRNAQRYDNLERILAGNRRRGGISNERKKLILLTATPINNSVFDLYNQVNLFTGGDRSYFAAAGIGDLYRYFQIARRANRQQESGIALFNLLEEVVIRRTRPFIKQAYPNATIKGQAIQWPERT